MTLAVMWRYRRRSISAVHWVAVLGRLPFAWARVPATHLPGSVGTLVSANPRSMSWSVSSAGRMGMCFEVGRHAETTLQAKPLTHLAPPCAPSSRSPRHHPPWRLA